MEFSVSRFRIALLAVFACAALAGAPNPRTVSAPLQQTNDPKPAPPFQLLDSSGKAVRLSDFRGRVVLLNFWATDCGGCRLEIPWFVELDAAYKDKKVSIVGVSLDISYEELKNATQAWARVSPFVRDHQIHYKILMEDPEVTKTYNTTALPATYLIDQQGRIAATYVGLINKGNVAANIDSLLVERH